MFEFLKNLFKKKEGVVTVDEILAEQSVQPASKKKKATKKPAEAGLEVAVVKKRRGRPPKAKV